MINVIGIYRSDILARPSMMSYAQNGEDVVLNRAFGHQNSGFYIDIGACHPVEDSVTFHFYNRGWQGVNVEPDQVLFTAFLDERPRDTNINAAVGQSRGRITFNPTGTRGHGTLDTALAEARSVGRLPERVPLITLSDVIDCYGPDDGKIDFLKIDVEGWEAEVIASGDWKRQRPRVVVIEAVDDTGDPTHLVWEPTLLEAGYHYLMFDGLNRFYCRNEDMDELASRLDAPSNVRDGWIRARDSATHESLIRSNSELTAASQERAAAEVRAEALGADLEAVRAELLEESALARVKLQEADKRCSSLETQLEQVFAELESVKARSQVLEVVVAEARNDVATALHREEEAEASMVALETERTALKGNFTTMARDLAALEDDLSRRQLEAQALRDKHEELIRQSHHSTATVAALYASTSWKISRPIRVVGRLLKRPGG